MAYESLNIRQRKFVDEYIITGNATQSAIKAGYSEKTAESQASRLLSNVKISSALKERSESLWNEKQMTVSEALALSASIARGDPQKSYFKEIDHLNDDEVKKETTKYYIPSTEDRQRSLDHIFKVNGAYLERQQIDATVETSKLDNILKQLSDDDE